MIARAIRPPTAALLAAMLAGVLAAAALVTRATPATATTPTPTPVLSTTVLGYSVLGRPIVAYRLGDPNATSFDVVLGQMHGDEHAGVVVANSLIHGSVTVEGIGLYVIPTMNPDGDARHTRQNAHGVDLNRNWPDDWAPLTGEYYAGSKPLSEPESQAMYRFLLRVRPKWVVSLHQPLDGVDSTDGTGPAYAALRSALSRNLQLPVKAFNCWSVCHGSMSGWYKHRKLGGLMETVEFGWRPATAYLTGTARRGIIAALHGRFGSIAAHDPRHEVHLHAASGAVTISGWAVDPDAPSRHLTYLVEHDGRTIARRSAWASGHGGHGIAFTVAAGRGWQRYCVTVLNLGAGTGDPRTCGMVKV